MNGHYKIPLAKGADPMADPRVKRLIASFDTGAQVRIDVREETLQLYKYNGFGWLKMDTAPRYVEIVATGGKVARRRPSKPTVSRPTLET